MEPDGDGSTSIVKKYFAKKGFTYCRYFKRKHLKNTENYVK
jgi:hypothetical protein